MAIVVLCENEESRTLEGPTAAANTGTIGAGPALPTDNGPRSASSASFCHVTDRPAFAIHQMDPSTAKAFGSAGAPEMIGSDGLIRDATVKARACSWAWCSRR
ncbi:hypothetical protein CH35J_000470 [Colletotrichum higginsianum]|uniref:Uncharacterized protein n=1 Tax=Colletotrichum higginsianum TaxID=80884 RepID=A0A4T0WJP1_9PEZI|nr:hypothetical protein CH35J_000470 [Colletotrichum higginsianum]